MDNGSRGEDLPPEPRVVTARASARAHASVGVARVLIRSYFSSQMLWTSRHLSELAGAIESNHEGDSGFDIEHRGYVLASILAAVGFLEAMINELYQDAADGHGLTGDGYLAPLTASTHRLMAELWRATDEGAKLRALDKYDMLLAFTEGEAFDRGARPYQDAHLVVRLRNAIAHYQPEYLSAEDPHAIEKALRGRFAGNALMAGSGNSWWTDHALGYGCTEWAHRSVKALADETSQRLRIEPNYRRLERARGYGRAPG